MQPKKNIPSGLQENRVISLHERWESRKQDKARKDGDWVVSEEVRASFLYTLDLLVDSFGKKHVKKYCALCEPMRVMGEHRDEVIVQLVVALFTSFFQSFATTSPKSTGLCSRIC